MGWVVNNKKRVHGFGDTEMGDTRNPGLRLRGGVDEDMADVEDEKDESGFGEDEGMQEASEPIIVGKGQKPDPPKRVAIKRRPVPKRKPPARRRTGPSSKPSTGRRTRQRLERPNFSIKRSGRSFTLFAREVNDAVLNAVKAFLRNRKGVLYVDGSKMTKAAALRYISVQLRKKGVIVSFRRR